MRAHYLALLFTLCSLEVFASGNEELAFYPTTNGQYSLYCVDANGKRSRSRIISSEQGIIEKKRLDLKGGGDVLLGYVEFPATAEGPAYDVYVIDRGKGACNVVYAGNEFELPRIFDVDKDGVSDLIFPSSSAGFDETMNSRNNKVLFLKRSQTLLASIDHLHFFRTVDAFWRDAWHGWSVKAH